MIGTCAVSAEVIVLTALLFYWSEGAARLLAGLGGIVRGGGSGGSRTLEASWDSGNTVFQLPFLATLEFALVNADGLIDKEFESFLSTDYRDGVLDIWLQSLVKQETLAVIIDVKGGDECLEFHSIVGSRFRLQEDTQFVFTRRLEVPILIEI